MAMPTTIRIAAMVAAAAIFFSTFHNVSAQREAPAPAPSSKVGGAPAPTEMVAAPAPSPLAGCTDSLLNVSSCLPYVMNGSTTTKPDTGCCPELAGLVESNPICLCVLLGTNTTESLGVAIDVQKALKLPSVCGVQTPPASTCSVLGVPVPGPVGSPTASEGPMAPISPAPTEVVAAPTPSPLAGCTDSLLNVSSCLPYVMNGSTTTKPDTGCCPELAGLVESNPICLCVLLGTNTTESLGVAIDVQKALKLPSVCGVQTPPASTCSVLGVPVPSPVGSPTASMAPHSPGGAQTPGGAAAALSPGNNDNEASSIAGSALPIIVGLAIAFLPTFF